MDLVGDSWLVDLGLRDKKAQGVAAVLLRTQVLTYRRRGHLIDLHDAQVRLDIEHRAWHGRISKRFARCLRCGTQASVNDWVRAIDLTDAARAFTLQGAHQERNSDLDYMRDCRGADVIAEGLSLLGLIVEEGK